MMAQLMPDVEGKVTRIAPYADRCPVCDGRGKVPGWFYEELVLTASIKDFGQFFANRKKADPVTCRGCDGAGWVVVR